MITVVGPGAVGGLLAALLHRAGEDVVAVARPATAQRLAAEGLHVRSDAFGTWTAHVPATTEVPPGSAVVLAVKAYALDAVLPGIVAARPSEVLALLNGAAHAEALRAAGLENVACGSIQVESVREQDAIVHHGQFCIVTVPDAAAGGEVPAALARAGVSVRTGGTENEVLWRKYSFLAPMALLTSWTDLPIGQAIERDPAVTDGILAEVAAVATAEGLALDPERLTAALHRLPDSMLSSLQHDIRRGGESELEALGGNLLRLAAAHGIAAPALARVVGDLRERVG